MVEELIHAKNIISCLKSRDEDNLYSLDELREEMKNKYGENAKFTNCSQKPYTFDQIIEFIKNKGKISIDENNKIKFLGCSGSNHCSK